MSIGDGKTPTGQLRDILVWFNHHHDTIPKHNLQGRVEFMEKLCVNMLDLLITWHQHSFDKQREMSSSLLHPRGIIVDPGPGFQRGGH